jgi:hypothetical protein
MTGVLLKLTTEAHQLIVGFGERGRERVHYDANIFFTDLNQGPVRRGQSIIDDFISLPASIHVVWRNLAFSFSDFFKAMLLAIFGQLAIRLGKTWFLTPASMLG